jgi:hypothetical protein
MPWSKAQNKLFRAAEHNPEIAAKHGMSHATATKLAHEGVMREHKEGHKHSFRSGGKNREYMRSKLHAKDPSHEEMHAHGTAHHVRDDEHPDGHYGRDHHTARRGMTGGTEYHMTQGPGEGGKHGVQGLEYAEHEDYHGPSGHTMHQREQLSEKGRKQIHETRHMALANTTDGELTAPAKRDANFAQREHHNGKADLRGAMGDVGSFHYEGHEVGSEGLRNNLGSKRVSGHGEPQAGTSTLAGRPMGKEHVSGMGGQGPSGLPAHEHGAGQYAAGARDGAGGHPATDHLDDMTRGTHQLPAHRFAARENVPQEVKEALARTLVRRR